MSPFAPEGVAGVVGRAERGEAEPGRVPLGVPAVGEGTGGLLVMTLLVAGVGEGVGTGVAGWEPPHPPSSPSAVRPAAAAMPTWRRVTARHSRHRARRAQALENPQTSARHPH